MAFRHGRFAEITVAGNDLSAFCDSADINIDIDTAETTTFGASWKRHIPGLAGAQLDGGGNYDPTATTGPAAVLTGLIGDDPFAVVLHPGGDVTGQIQHSFNAILTSYKESSPVGDKVTFTFSLLVDGAVTTTNVA
jgi:hypothetical protein